MIGIDPLYMLLLAPFVFGAVLGTTAGYLVRAQRAWRDSWAADRRELHWRCELARTRWPQLYPPQQCRPHPSRHRRPRHRAAPA